MRTAIYVRVSTNMQVEDGYSLDGQIERCKAYCLSQGWEVIEVYIEEGESAKDLERPELKRLMEAAENNEFDVLLVYKLDRLTRSVRDLHAILDRFERLGIKFRSATEVYDTTTAMGKLFITIVAALAEWERGNLAERVRFGMETLVRDGKWHGGAVPFGYRWDEVTMHIVPEEEKILRELRRYYMAGNGFGATAKHLNSLGMKRRDGVSWQANAVNYTLDNPFYAGKMRYGTKKKAGGYVTIKKEEHVDVIWSDTNFPTIFTWEEYEEHMERIKRRRFYGTSKKREYWFSGVIRCARCGRAMMGRPYRNKDKWGNPKQSYINYICSGRSQSMGCNMPLLKQTLAEKMILEYVNALNVGTEEIAASAEIGEDHTNEIETTQKELRNVMERRKKWQYMFAEELMSEVDFRERKREEDEKEKILRDHIEALKAADIGMNGSNLSTLRVFSELWMDIDDGAKKEMMQTVFSNIYFECDVANGREHSRKGKSLPFRITEVNFN